MRPDDGEKKRITLFSICFFFSFAVLMRKLAAAKAKINFFSPIDTIAGPSAWCALAANRISIIYRLHYRVIRIITGDEKKNTQKLCPFSRRERTALNSIAIWWFPNGFVRVLRVDRIDFLENRSHLYSVPCERNSRIGVSPYRISIDVVVEENINYTHYRWTITI